MARQVNKSTLFERRNDATGGVFLCGKCGCFPELGEVNYRYMERLPLLCRMSSQKTPRARGGLDKTGEADRQHEELGVAVGGTKCVLTR